MRTGKIYHYGLLAGIFFLLALVPQQVHGADKSFNKTAAVTLTDKESYSAAKDYVWIKYKPSADGYLTIRASDASAGSSGAKGYLALFDSTKKQILSSKSIYYHTGNTKNPYWFKITFGLRGKQEYYIRVKAQNAVTLSATFQKVNDKSGDLQSTALEIKAKKKKTGLFPAGTTTADWYKLTLKKAQKLHLYYQARTSGSFRISIYAGTRRLAARNIYYTFKQQKLTLYRLQNSTGKKLGMDAGVYYIKVEKADVTSSGYYTLKWN